MRYSEVPKKRPDVGPDDPGLKALMERLVASHGEIVRDATLAGLLGYPTTAAFRQAVKRNRCPVPIFTLENRRGKFALTHEVAAWLHRCNANALRLARTLKAK